MNLRGRIRAEHGFTVIESLVAAVILIIGVLSTLSLIDGANKTTVKNRQREAGIALAREVVEAARAISYEDLAEPGFSAALAAQPGLEDTTAGSTYTISRRGYTYTVTGQVCVMDDLNDGAGPRGTGSTFCADAPAAGTADRNPEDYKRVTVKVAWKSNTTTRQVTQTAVVNNPGSASGPAIRSLIPKGFSTPMTANVNELTFSATTSSKPTTINWLLDGTVMTPVPYDVGGQVAWEFKWNIQNTDDGPYLVSAEAFNQYGVSGPGRSLTVTLNRFAPRRPTAARGGRSILFPVVDIEWSANTERDIVGYQVYRQGKTEPICTLQTQTTCTDTNPPATGDVRYFVYAYDFDASNSLRASDGAQVDVRDANTRPYAPQSLTGQMSNGIVKLTWNQPSPEDPDGGDQIAYYRVYRDGQLLSNRYDTAGTVPGAVSYFDRDHKGVPRTYWVTAVDRNLGESTMVGPVTVTP